MYLVYGLTKQLESSQRNESTKRMVFEPTFHEFTSSERNYSTITRVPNTQKSQY